MPRHLRRRGVRIGDRTRRAIAIARVGRVAADAPRRGRTAHGVDAVVRMEPRVGRLERRARRRGPSARPRVRARGRAGRRYATLRRMRATTAGREHSALYTYLICLAAWAIPGAGH